MKSLLFRLDAETAHALTVNTVRTLALLPGFVGAVRAVSLYEHPALGTDFCGLTLPNPLGLAAGFDKDALLVRPLLGLGFGAVEVGTVTPRPQAGNARPRLFRLPPDHALINRMGFNNRGAYALGERLRRLRRTVGAGVVGVNLGKQRETPLDEAVVDYLTCLHAAHEGADYAVINVSSPNTPGLRDLQGQEALEALLGVLVAERDKLAAGTGRRLPLLLKIAPDLTDEELAGIAECAEARRIDGVIATNTTLARPELRGRHREQPGGLSGRPLRSLALHSISRLYRLTGGRLPLVGVGGICDADDAYAFIRAGASWVQLYTGLVYQGPGLVRRIKRGLVQRLAADGFERVSEAVGADQRD